MQKKRKIEGKTGRPEPEQASFTFDLILGPKQVKGKAEQIAKALAVGWPKTMSREGVFERTVRNIKNNAERGRGYFICSLSGKPVGIAEFQIKNMPQGRVLQSKILAVEEGHAFESRIIGEMVSGFVTHAPKNISRLREIRIPRSDLLKVHGGRVFSLVRERHEGVKIGGILQIKLRLSPQRLKRFVGIRRTLGRIRRGRR